MEKPNDRACQSEINTSRPDARAVTTVEVDRIRLEAAYSSILPAPGR